ncbi:MAG: M1 family metallopeptidase [Candidatus Lokiarchaeota archaeon]
MKKIKFTLLLFLIYICFFGTLSSIIFNSNDFKDVKDLIEVPTKREDPPKIAPLIAGDNSSFSKCNLTVVFSETTSSVEGNLTVDFYNNDPHNFTRIPFHLYLSGMMYDSRKGSITILDVFELGNFSQKLSYTVYNNQQLLWINLLETLQPYARVKFVISFISVLPDGGYDRANSYGSDYSNSRIYKFASFYPIPCVYDKEDQWNTDPYLHTGDPFYFDMAYYNLFIKASKDMIIAATGKLIERKEVGTIYLYHFDPIYPVREVTFSASKDFIVETTLLKGINVSVYYLPKSSEIWQGDALKYVKRALSLYNSTFGEYPYPTLNIVEEYTIFGGMEYPCQVYATEAIDTWGYPLGYKKGYLEKVIAHESCHQWWYNLIGNDEVDYGFLDEGLTCWSTDYYGEHYYADWEHFQLTPYIDEVRTNYIETGQPSRINQTVYECASTNTDYYFVSYHKAPLIFELLRDYVGSEHYLKSLKTYFKTFEFEIVDLRDLQNVFENVTGSDLDWFFYPMFDNLYLPKYSFQSPNYNHASGRLTVSIYDKFESLNPYSYSQKVPFQVLNAQDQIIFSENIWINGTTIVNISLNETPKLIKLLYNDYKLVQLDYPEQTSLSLTLNSFSFQFLE